MRLRRKRAYDAPMKISARHLVFGAAAAIVAGSGFLAAQQQSGLTAAEKQRRWDTENELQSIAVVERKVMLPMPDGVHLATDIYRPKNMAKAPVIWVRTRLRRMICSAPQGLRRKTICCT